jgi:hypothetical protein
MDNKLDNKLNDIDKLEVGCTYTYKKLTDTLGWKTHMSTSSNGCKAQLRLIECYYEIVKTNVGKCNGYYIKAKRKEPLPIASVGREKQNLTLQFENEQTYEKAKALIKDVLDREGIEFKIVVAKGRNR